MKKHMLGGALLSLGMLAFTSCGSETIVTGSGALLSIGSASAPIVITEYGDFQCPGCQYFHQSILPTLKKEYIDSGKARYEYKDFPVHATAPAAHNATHCAAAQGKYAEYADILYANIEADKQIVPKLKEYAKDLGLDQKAFDTCVDSNQFAGVVNANRRDGIIKGVAGTPTVFVNDTMIESTRTAEEIKQAVEKALGK